MNKEGQIADIAKRTGLNSAVIREVLKGVRESAIDTLRRGDTYNIYGLCTFSTTVKERVLHGGDVEKYLSVHVKATNALKDDINFNKGTSGEKSIDISTIDTDVITRDLLILR